MSYKIADGELAAGDQAWHLDRFMLRVKPVFIGGQGKTVTNWLQCGNRDIDWQDLFSRPDAAAEEGIKIAKARIARCKRDIAHSQKAIKRLEARL